ncbi:MAG: hypothetical protein ACKESB_00915 [Candidatus Hodgkinia cicadicola]
MPQSVRRVTAGSKGRERCQPVEKLHEVRLVLGLRLKQAEELVEFVLKTHTLLPVKVKLAFEAADATAEAR